MKKIEHSSRLGTGEGFWQRYLGCLAAPAVAVLLGLLVYAVYHLYPFSHQILAWGDMSQQSIPLLIDWKRILTGQFDMFLNTANAGGMSFWGVFLFFLASPVNFLVAWVPVEQMFHFANLLVLFKLAIAAFTACIFFRRQFRQLSMVQAVTLSAMYAFCGFAMLYYQNIIWLDMLWAFPILLMGVADLLQKQKVLLYGISLCAVVIINYYLSYMLVLFLVLAVAAYIAIAAPKGVRCKTLSRFVLTSVLSALVTAVFWMPSLLQYLHSGRTTNVYEGLITSPTFTTIPTVFPVILCTGTVVAMLPMFFVSKLHRNRTAVALFAVQILTLLPVIFEPINKMWHTGSYQAFPVRYGYITVMLGLCLTAMFLSQTNCLHQKEKAERSIPLLLIVSGLTLAFAAIGIILLLQKQEALAFYVNRLWVGTEQFLYLLLFSGMAILLYFLLYLLYHNRMLHRRWCSVFLCVIAGVEIFFHSAVFLGSASRSAWTYDNALQLSDRIEHSEDLYRTKLYRKYFDVNLVGALGYNTTSHYTSLTDQDFMFAMKKLGYSSYWMEIGSNGGTELTDILLANRYTIIKNVETTAQQPLYESLIYSIVENPAVHSFGQVFSAKDISALETLPDCSRMELQQWLYALFYGKDTVVTAYQPTTARYAVLEQEAGTWHITATEKPEDADSLLRYTIPVQGTQTLYFDCFDQISNRLKEAVNDSFSVFVNGVQVDSSFPNQKNNGLLCLGTYTNQMVTVELHLRKASVQAKSFGVYGIAEEKIAQANEKKPSTSLTRDGNTISGTVTGTDETSYLFLPMAYDTGYTAEINGQPAEIVRVLDAFLAIPIPKGESSLTLTYVPRGFRTGAICTGAGLVLFALAMLLLKKGWLRGLRWLKLPLSILFWIGTVGVLFVVYFMPMLLNLLGKVL